MKKILSVVLVMVLICGSVFAGGSKESSSSSGKVVLEILSLKNEPSALVAFDELTARFTELHPEIELDIQSMTSDNLKTTMRARAASGDMPDLITWMKEIEPEYLMDLSGEDFISNLNSETVAAANAIYESGKVYAMPIDNGYIGMYYNKDVLAAYGLELPRTVSELKNVCETLAANGVTPFATSAGDLSVPYMSLIALFAETVYGRNPDWSAERDEGLHQIVTDADWKLAFDLLNEFVYGYSDLNNLFNMDADGSAAMLANGQAAFYGNGSWALSTIRGVNENANIGLAAFPISENPDEAKLLCFPDTSFSICADTEHAEAAKLFLEFMTSEEAGEIWSRNMRVSSTVNGVNVDYDPISADVNYYISNNLFTPYGDRVLRSTFTDKLWEDFSKYMLGISDWNTIGSTLDEFWDRALEIENETK